MEILSLQDEKISSFDPSDPESQNHSVPGLFAVSYIVFDRNAFGYLRKIARDEEEIPTVPVVKSRGQFGSGLWCHPLAGCFSSNYPQA